MLDQDTSRARWTRVTTDVDGIRTAQSIWHSGVECGYEPPPGTVTASLPGWPVNCSLVPPGLPGPHDPPGALRPPDLSQPHTLRRAIADDIAAELADTGHQGRLGTMPTTVVPCR